MLSYKIVTRSILLTSSSIYKHFIHRSKFSNHKEPIYIFNKNGKYPNISLDLSSVAFHASHGFATSYNYIERKRTKKTYDMNAN